MDGGGWWWVLVDIFWLVVDGGGSWWVMVGLGESWWVVAQFSLTFFFKNIHRKTHALESLFNKVDGPQVCNVMQKRLLDRCFPVCTL